MTGNDVEKEAREEKLRVFLEDFDNEAKAKVAHMRRLGEGLQQLINNAYSMEFFKIPKKVRDMKVIFHSTDIKTLVNGHR